MWMCSRCQSINDGESAGAICPKCGATAPEPTIPPRPAATLEAAQQTTGESQAFGSPDFDPITPVKTPSPEVAHAGSARTAGLTASESDDKKYALDQPAEEELSEDEYEKLTTPNPLVKSPLIAVILIVVAVIAVGSVVYTQSLANSGSDDIVGPSMLMTHILAHRHSFGQPVVGTWLGTDHSGASPTPVTYVFGSDGTLSISNPTASSASAEPIQAQYKIKSGSLDMEFPGSSTPVVSQYSRDDTNLIISRPVGALTLKEPRAVVGTWSGALPTLSGTQPTKLVFIPDGSLTLSAVGSDGKMQTVNGNYSLLGNSMSMTMKGDSPISASLAGNTLVTFDGNSLVLLPQASGSAGPTPLYFSRT